jgi:hypothetical protein
VCERVTPDGCHHAADARSLNLHSIVAGRGTR